MNVRLIQAHCIEALAGLEAGSVHTCVCSPPYWGLRSYGTEPQVWGAQDCDHDWSEHWTPNNNSGAGAERPFDPTCGPRGGSLPRKPDGPRGRASAFCAKCGAWRGELGAEPTPELYVAHLVEVFREVRRVLHPSGTLWLNLGDSYASSGTFDGVSDKSGLNKGRGVGPNEKVKQPLGRAPTPPGLKPKDLCGIPWTVALALRGDGWYLRSEIIWSKGNPMPESVTDRPTRAHEQVFLLAKEARYYFDQEAVREKYSGPMYEGRDNGAILNGDRGDRGKTIGMSDPAGRNIRSVWTINTHSFPGAHFATFPPALAERCIRAGSSERGCCPTCRAPWARIRECVTSWRDTAYEADQSYVTGSGNPTVRPSCGGMSTSTYRPAGWRQTCPCPPHDPQPCVVLDPFSGAGTSLMVADRLGRDAIGIDLNPDYTAMAERRVTKDAGLFAEVATESTPQRTQAGNSLPLPFEE